VTTFAQLVDEVIGKLQGFTVSPDQVTYITADITSGATALTVDDPAQLGSGIAEIDDELIYIKAVDNTTGSVTLPPFGRGYRSTTAAAHTANTKFVMSPDWPRSMVKQEINRTIAALYPTLYAVKEAPTFTTNGVTYQFDVPAASERVVDVRWLFNPVDGWMRAHQWEQENSAPTSFTNDRYISIYDALPPGSTVQVLYATQPTALVNSADDYAATTGLPDSSSDVVVLGVMARLAQFLDLGRLTIESASADALAQQRPTGGPTQIAAQLYRQYQQRLEDERKSLSQRYPARAHKTR
jgi:hypothetical protein